MKARKVTGLTCVLGFVMAACLFSPCLSCADFKLAWGTWRAHVGLDLGGGMRPLLDLRLANDALIFAKSRQRAFLLLDELVRQCARIGLILNAGKKTPDH